MVDLVFLLIAELGTRCKRFPKICAERIVCTGIGKWRGPRLHKERLRSGRDAECGIVAETRHNAANVTGVVSCESITHVHDESGAEDNRVADLRVVVPIRGNLPDVVKALHITRPKNLGIREGVPLQSAGTVNGMPPELVVDAVVVRILAKGVDEAGDVVVRAVGIDRRGIGMRIQRKNVKANGAGVGDDVATAIGAAIRTLGELIALVEV